MPRDPDTAFAAARATDPDRLGRDQLAAHLVDLRVVRSWIDAAEVRAARRGAALAEQGTASSPEAANVRLGHRSSKNAQTISDRAGLCSEMPQFEAALNAGTLSAAHVDVVARAVRTLDEVGRSMLVDSAAAFGDEAGRSTVDAFDRSMRKHARAIAAATAGASDAEELDAQRRRSSVKRWVDKITGMHHTRLELDPLPRRGDVAGSERSTCHRPSG